EVTHAGAGGVSDGRGLGHADAEYAARRARLAGTDADEHPDRTGAHEVERSLVRGAPPDDHRDLQLANELLAVEGLDRLRDVHGGDNRALDHQQVELGLEDRLGELLGALGRDRRARDDTAVLDLPDAL